MLNAEWISHFWILKPRTNYMYNVYAEFTREIFEREYFGVVAFIIDSVLLFNLCIYHNITFMKRRIKTICSTIVLQVAIVFIFHLLSTFSIWRQLMHFSFEKRCPNFPIFHFKNYNTKYNKKKDLILIEHPQGICWQCNQKWDRPEKELTNRETDNTNSKRINKIKS